MTSDISRNNEEAHSADALVSSTPPKMPNRKPRPRQPDFDDESESPPIAASSSSLRSSSLLPSHTARSFPVPNNTNDSPRLVVEDAPSDEDRSEANRTASFSSSEAGRQSDDDDEAASHGDEIVSGEALSSEAARRAQEEADSIALARMLMEQEAMESYAISADYLRQNADQFSQEDYQALQAALAEDQGDDEDEEAEDRELSYDMMLRLGESIGDVKQERWALVSQSEIDKLEMFQFDPEAVKEKDENDSDVKCLVCQCPFEKDDTLRRLPCQHCYHSECADQWLKAKDFCPYCRQTIVTSKSESS